MNYIVYYFHTAGAFSDEQRSKLPYQLSWDSQHRCVAQHFGQGLLSEMLFIFRR